MLTQPPLQYAGDISIFQIYDAIWIDLLVFWGHATADCSLKHVVVSQIRVMNTKIAELVVQMPECAPINQ